MNVRWRIAAKKSEIEADLDRLDGMLETSKPRDILRECERILDGSKLTANQFYRLIIVVGHHGKFDVWAPKLKAYVSDQPKSRKVDYQRAMLSFYAGYGDWKNAARLVDSGTMKLPHEIALGFEALARARRSKVNEKMLFRCLRNFPELHSPIALGYHHMAAGWEFVREGHFAAASSTWIWVDVKHPAYSEAMMLATCAALAAALVTARTAIREYKRQLQNFAPEEISLPGIADALATRKLRLLVRQQRAAERALPADWHALVAPFLTDEN